MSLSISPLSPILQFLALSAVSLILTVLIPFTKVEESFAMQAIHDFIYLAEPKNLIRLAQNALDQNHYHNLGSGLDLFQRLVTVNSSGPRWDHQDFPGELSALRFLFSRSAAGVVHRTFVGPFAVSLLARPLSTWFHTDDKFYVQVLSRAVLLLAVMYAFSVFGRAIESRYGPTTRRALSVLTLTQFHFLFYASRCLPNTFALIAVMLALAMWLERKWNKYIAAVAFTVVVLRAETVILFAWVTAHEVLVTRQLSVMRLLRVGVPAGVAALGFTVLFDSYMWGRPVWPEGE